MKKTFCLIILVSLIFPLFVGNADSITTPYNTSVIVPLITEDVSGWNKTKPAWPYIGPTDEIVFLWKNIENYSVVGIYMISSNGSNLRLLYANKSIDISFSGPKFSPDGNEIIFCSGWYDKQTGLGGDVLDRLIRNGSVWDNTSIYERVYKATSAFLKNPAYSPDGTKIVYLSNEGTYIPLGQGDVWIMDKDGTNRTRLTYDGNGGYYPSFSPDGKKIIYMPFGPGGNYELWMMDSDGGNKKRLLDESWYPNEACFTPNGKILFRSARVSPHSSKLEDGNIWMMNMDGSNKMLVVPEKSGYDIFSTRPSMSVDRGVIIFDHGLGKYAGIYKVEDPTGEWKDSDGDGIWDGIDGAPYDPKAGYIKDEEDFWAFLPFGDLFLILGVALIIIVISAVIVALILTQKKRERSPPPQ